MANKRVALVIGNSSYIHTSELTNPKNDALDISETLTSLGFIVISGIDVDKTRMEQKIRQFATKLVGAEVGLFFYAGHGLQVEGLNYLVPIDAEVSSATSLDFELIKLQLVQRIMERETKTNVIFLDACRDNPLTRNLARALGTRSSGIGKGLAQVEAGVGTLISYATQPGNVALDGKGRNSPYTSALKHRLKAPGEDLTSILIKVRNDVMAATANQQVPWDQHSLTGQLFLSKPIAKIEKDTSPSALNEAAQVWTVTKDSNSSAVLKAYASRYAGTVFADMASARLNELQNSKAEKKVTMRAPEDRSKPESQPEKIQADLILPKGRYKSSWGMIDFNCDSAGKCTGHYSGAGDWKPAKIIGSIDSTGLLEGVWIEVASNTRCKTKKDDSNYWGRARLLFDQNRNSWAGVWSYCDVEPATTWKGSK